MAKQAAAHASRARGSTQFDMGGLAGLCPCRDVHMRVLRAKASSWHVNSETPVKMLPKKLSECFQRGNCSLSISGCRTLYLTPGRAMLQTPSICPAALSAPRFWHELSSVRQRAQIWPPGQTAAGTGGKFIRREEMETEKLKTAKGK